MTVVLFDSKGQFVGSMPKFEAAMSVVAFRDEGNRLYTYWRLDGTMVWFREVDSGIVANINTKDLSFLR